MNCSRLSRWLPWLHRTPLRGKVWRFFLPYLSSVSFPRPKFFVISLSIYMLISWSDFWKRACFGQHFVGSSASRLVPFHELLSVYLPLAFLLDIECFRIYPFKLFYLGVIWCEIRCDWTEWRPSRSSSFFRRGVESRLTDDRLSMNTLSSYGLNFPKPLSSRHYLQSASSDIFSIWRLA